MAAEAAPGAAAAAAAPPPPPAPGPAGSVADSTVEGPEAVPPPPAPFAGEGPSRRRARVVMEPQEEDDGPTYYRIGVDYEYAPEDEEIHLQCARIKKLENLEAAGPRLKKLCLIANCIEKIEGLEANTGLRHLELYQNLLKKIENIGHLKELTTLDFSFNRIRTTAPLGSCQFDKLERLYVSSNKIVDVEGIFHFHSLKMLELGSNRVRAIPTELGQLTNLEELWLGRNKITSMALPPLPALRHLSMQNNRLEAWDASFFQHVAGVTHLYLGHNNLPDLPDEFSLLTELVELDLAKNAITVIKPFQQLEKLQELWMNDNQISDLSEVRNLAAFSGLQTVYLERNPMHGLGSDEAEDRYKEAILQVVPRLKQLDAVRLNHKVTVISDGSERQVVGIRRA